MSLVLKSLLHLLLSLPLLFPLAKYAGGCKKVQATGQAFQCGAEPVPQHTPVTYAVFTVRPAPPPPPHSLTHMGKPCLGTAGQFPELGSCQLLTTLVHAAIGEGEQGGIEWAAGVAKNWVAAVDLLQDLWALIVLLRKEAIAAVAQCTMRPRQASMVLLSMRYPSAQVRPRAYNIGRPLGAQLGGDWIVHQHPHSEKPALGVLQTTGTCCLPPNSDLPSTAQGERRIWGQGVEGGRGKGVVEMGTSGPCQVWPWPPLLQVIP